MILAERLCLLALDQRTGLPHMALDRERFFAALAGLVAVDLMFAQRLRLEAGQIWITSAMPIAHPVLTDATQRLSRHGSPYPVALALPLLRGQAPSWQRRINKGLVARDILELTTPWPFVRRLRPRSKQAWNECVDPLRAFADGDDGTQSTLALAIALRASAVLGEVIAAETARALIARLPARDAASTSAPSLPELLNRLIAPA